MTRDALIARRQALGLTQLQLAKEFGVSLRAYAQWERGERWPGYLAEFGMETILTRLEAAHSLAALAA